MNTVNSVSRSLKRFEGEKEGEEIPVDICVPAVNV